MSEKFPEDPTISNDFNEEEDSDAPKVTRLADVKIEKMRKSGILDYHLSEAGDEIKYYEEQKAKGKEVMGKWSISAVEKVDDHNEIRFLIAKDEQTGE